MADGIDVAGDQIQGGRPRQEDAYRITASADRAVLVVADGMGGHAGGDVASRVAADAMQRALDALTGDADEPALRRALAAANAAVGEAARDDRALRGMGTTLVGAVVTRDRCVWASVGDSPLWLRRDETLIRLNADHSLRAELDEKVRAGRLSPEAAAHDPARHMLREAVSGEALQTIDAGSRPLVAGDAVVAASDGIETLTVADLSDILGAAPSAAAGVDRALAAVEAEAAPRQDNVTLVVARLPAAT